MDDRPRLIQHILPPIKSRLLVAFLFLFYFSKAQLVINEVSQGQNGAKEYVELVVVGTPTCTTVPCIDLRGYYIDDNNGNYATGSGTGIATGCIRLTNNALWSCVPAGTIILIYNDADMEPGIPSQQDTSLTDGNCTLIIAISNCLYFEKNTATPSTSTSTYPTTGFTPCGDWANIGMSNSNDSFQTLTPAGNPVFSVSWGNNNVNTVIYFSSTSQGGKLCYNANSSDTNPFNQANWVNVSVAGAETPGLPNNAANAAWINSMSNSCGTILPLTTTFTTTPSGCSCTGTATVIPSGAVSPYTYSWSPAGTTSSSVSSLCAGNYSVTVSSPNGCVVTNTVSISSSVILTASITSTDVSCNGLANGSSAVTVGGGSGSYTYSWSPSGGTASSASSLAPGTYTVTIADGLCTATATTTISEPPVLTSGMNASNITCFGSGNGTATVTAGGGTGAYTYSWAPSGGIDSSASGLSQGIYTVTVTDAMGCITNTTATISEPPAITPTITSTPAVCNGGTGTASVSASGGTGAYTYSWSPAGGTTAGTTALPAGNYSVTVTDANGCTATGIAAISEPPALTVMLTSTNATCNTNNGSAYATVSGGTGPYSYTWSPQGGNSDTADLLSPGVYTVTIQDANNCPVTGSTTITQPPAFTVTIASTDVTCNKGSDGSLTANVSGGTAPFTYSWSPSGGTGPSTGNTLPAGNYMLIVNDASGCSTSLPGVITEPAPVLVSATSATACSGQAATLTASASGGNGAPYTYTWSNGATGTTATVSATSNTAYTVIAMDNQGCTSPPATANVNVSSPLTAWVASNDTVCPGKQATLTAIPGGGTGNYTITWLPGGMTGSTIQVSPGSTTVYTVIVSDGCTIPPATASGQVVITANPVISFNPNPASGCAPVCVSLAVSVSTVSGNDIASLTWHLGDGSTATGLNVSHCYETSGSFGVYLVGVTQMGCRDSVLKNNLITVFPQPHADFDASAFITDMFEPTIHFYDLSQSSLTSWNWDFQAGTSLQQNPVFTFPAEGTYPVSLIATNAQGCKDSITKFVTIKPAYTFYAPNAMTPNFDGMNDVFLPVGTAWDPAYYDLWVFDRWGNEVFHSSDTNQGWDGTKHGEAVMQDVYVWKIELRDLFGTPHEYNGVVSVIRN